MIKTVIGNTLTVGELIEKLKKYPLDMPVCDYGFGQLQNVSMKTWIDSNYPFDAPDTDFVCVDCDE